MYFDLKLLTDSSGRLGQRPYWILAAALLVAGFVLSALPVVGPLISILLIWPWLCLFCKRVRDAGRDHKLAMMMVTPLAISAVMSAVVGMAVLVPLLADVTLLVTALLSPVLLIVGVAGLAMVVWAGLMPPKD